VKDVCCVFPDTNIFLHFPPLKDFDWCVISDAKEVRLVICMTVIHELDAKKSDSRLSSRAERAIKEIRDAQKPNTETRQGVTVSVFNREIRAADFPESLSIESADDCIVHLAKLYRSENADIHVAIATGDYGMELRAASAGVEAISIDSARRLANPQDELTKKYHQAVTELNAIKNRRPKLNLGLSAPNGGMSAPHEIAFELGELSTFLNIDAEMESLKSKYPKQSRPRAHSGSLMADLVTFPGFRESMKEYDSELEAFYEGYREFLKLKETIRQARARMCRFDLWLQNDGNGIATNLDIFLTFPPLIQLVADKQSEGFKAFESEPKAPKPPKKPSPADLASFRVSIPVDRIPNTASIVELMGTPRDEWTPGVSIHRNHSHSCEIRIRLGKIMHGRNVRLGEFLLLFRTREEIGPFSTDCSISAAELPEKLLIQMPFMAKLKGSNA